MRLKRIIELLIGLGVGLACLAPRLAPAQTPVVPGIYTTSNANQVVGWAAISSSNPLPISGSFSATLSGFTPASVYATPLSVSNSSSRVALPAGTVVAVYNTGTTAAYCQLGNSSVTATTSSDFIPGNSAIGFTVGSNVDIACITATGTTTVNLSGGSGLLTGFGGGGSSGGSNAAASATGSAVPASASYNGINIGGTLRGQTGVNPTGSVFAAANDITSMGGTAINSGCVGALSGFSAAIPSTVCGVFGVYAINTNGNGQNTAANSSPVVPPSDMAGNVPIANLVFGTTASMTGTTSTQLLAAVTSKILYPMNVSCVNSSTSVDTLVTVQDGSGGTTLGTLTAPHNFGGDEKTNSTFPLFKTTAGNGLFVANVTTGAAVICTASGWHN